MVERNLCFPSLHQIYNMSFTVKKFLSLLGSHLTQFHINIDLNVEKMKLNIEFEDRIYSLVFTAASLCL